MSRTIAGFDLDEPADRIILPALIVGKSRGLPGVDLAASVTFETLGDVPADELADADHLPAGGLVHAPVHVLGQQQGELGSQASGHESKQYNRNRCEIITGSGCTGDTESVWWSM